MLDDTDRTFMVKPIGFVESDYHHFDDVPHSHTRQGWTKESCRIILSTEHAKNLQGLDGFSHLIVLFWVHRAKNWKMPAGHQKPDWVKVLATRMPRRPNPIGMSVVQLSGFSTETGIIDVQGLDCLDGTPVLDIKPYLAQCDSFPDATVPDWVIRKRAGLNHPEHHHSGRPHEAEHETARGER